VTDPNLGQEGGRSAEIMKMLLVSFGNMASGFDRRLALYMEFYGARHISCSSNWAEPSLRAHATETYALHIFEHTHPTARLLHPIMSLASQSWPVNLGQSILASQSWPVNLLCKLYRGIQPLGAVAAAAAKAASVRWEASKCLRLSARDLLVFKYQYTTVTNVSGKQMAI
jgi:hypothetical protein